MRSLSALSDDLFALSQDLSRVDLGDFPWVVIKFQILAVDLYRARSQSEVYIVVDALDRWGDRLYRLPFQKTRTIVEKLRRLAFKIRKAGWSLKARRAA
jgi:hypothetical protein